MKIYTKSGDKGTTSLFGGTRVPKFHSRIEAYGTIDELNSHMAILIDHIIHPNKSEMARNIQQLLFSAGSVLATETKKEHDMTIFNNGISALETGIDEMEEDLPQLMNFILPGGCKSNSYAHICRTVARRAERRIVALSEEVEVPLELIQYFNRLSDYFFVLSRWLSKKENADEIIWTN